MQAAAVNPQIDFTALKNISPQTDSSQADLYAASKKSFDEMIQASQKQNVQEKPALESKKDFSEEKVQETARAEVSEKKTEAAPDSAEPKEVVVSDGKSVKNAENEKSAEKTDVRSLLDRLALQKEVESLPADGEKSEELIKNRITELSPSELKELLANTKRLASTEEEKEAVSLEDIRNLTQNDDAALFASITAGENMLKAQENSDFTDLSQISENIFETVEISASSELSEKDVLPARTFAFDKDGKIIVKDYRSEKTEKTAEGGPVEKTALKVSDVKFDGNNAELTMEVPENIIQNVTSSSDQAAGAQGSNFQAMLTNQIQQNAGEFVKAGSIVLRDNDVGSIKLILKPENLGNVKVDLQISDKNITGRIVVASQEAFNAFKESADSLRQAFIESGFENASFDLAFAGQDASRNQTGGRDENPAATYNMAKAYGDYTDFGDEFVQMEESASFAPRSSVNIVA